MSVRLKDKLIGDRRFYKMLLAVAIPIMVQNGITNFVNLLDNIMVGQLGTEAMSGISVVNQLIFVFNLCIFGATSGVGIFTAQFYGGGDDDGVRHTFRFKLIICVALLAVCLAVFLLWGDGLIRMYMNDENEANVAAAMREGRDYLRILLIGLIPFTVSQVYSGTLREAGHTVLPMVSGAAAVIVNLVFNYILIFGKLGAPVMGVRGAAVATVMARFAELAIILIWTHTHHDKCPFMRGAYKTLRVPGSLVKRIAVKGTPLMINEMLWGLGVAMLMQCYSMRGLTTIAAMNINSTISNLFSIVFISLGNSVGIIIGQLLGADKMEEAKDADRKLIFFSFVCCLFVGAVMFAVSSVIPKAYNTSDEVRSLACSFIRIAAVFTPVHSITHACYFTLRSGGRTFITFLFDSVFLWCVNYPLAWCLAHLTDMHIVPLYLILSALDLIKVVIGLIMVSKGIWLRNIVDKG